MKFAHVNEGYEGASQDRLEVFEHKCGVVAILTDGAGGMSGAANAAETVVREMKELMGRLTRIPNPKFLVKCLATVDSRLTADSIGGETDAVVAVITDTKIMGASVGSSGAWMVDAAGYVDLTRDQLRKPRIGSGEAEITPFEYSPQTGTLLIACDGLLGYTTPQRIISVVAQRELKEAPAHLVNLVRLPNGRLQDDVSVALLKFE